MNKALSVTSRRDEDNESAHYQSFFGAKVILPSLEELVLSSLGDFKSIWQTSPSEGSFGKLMSIEIEYCSHLQTLLEDGQQNLIETTSSALEKPENAKIMEESPEKPVLGFPCLANLKVGSCAELSYLFSDTIARTLFELQHLHISSCQTMSVVVSAQKEEMMMFHKLRSLKLSELPILRCFSIGFAEHYFPFLRELWMSNCKKLEAFIKGSPNSSTSVQATPLFNYKAIIPNLETLLGKWQIPH